jgi:hypothetical protein
MKFNHVYIYSFSRNVDALKIQQKFIIIKEKKLVLDRGQLYIYILDLQCLSNCVHVMRNGILGRIYSFKLSIII